MTSRHKRPPSEGKVKTVVPWISKVEWETVKYKLTSEKIDEQIESLNRICAWKSRCYPQIPLGIEVTELLLHARIKDVKTESSSNAQFDHLSIVALYSLALIRFVNLVTDMGTKQINKSIPLHVLAEKVGIPLWLVETRHQATHSTLPSLSTLRTSYHLAMTWIQKHYWELESEQMNDRTETSSKFIGSVSNLFIQYDAMCISATPKKIWEDLKLKMMRSLVDHREEFINFLIDRLLKGDTTSPGCEWVVPWCPILKLFVQASNLDSLLVQMIESLGALENDGDSADRLQKWIILILTAVQPKACELPANEILSNLKFLKKATDVNWRNVLHTTLKTRSSRIPQFFPLLLEMLQPSVTQKQRERLSRLLSVINDDTTLEEPSSLNYFTLEDLQSVAPRPTKRLCVRKWEPATHIDWRKYPLGVLPNQFGLSSLNLDLDKRVDSLHRHKVPDNQAERLCETIAKESNDLGESSLLGFPNLQARLDLARHSVQPLTKWTEDELRNIKENLVIF